jgi:hypothetical protein
MPKAWVRIDNPKPIRGPQFDKHVKDCEGKAKLHPTKTKKHDEGDHVCVGVEPKDNGEAFVTCMVGKGYESARLDEGCEAKHGP